MECPFPGMDPFIVGSNLWQGFHNAFMTELLYRVNEQLPDHLYADLETGTIVSDVITGDQNLYQPDLGVSDNQQTSSSTADNYGAVTPVTLTATLRENQFTQRTLTVRTRQDRRLVAAVEMLSSTNKYGPGLLQYRKKRDDYRNGGVALLEIDLLNQYGRTLPEVTLPEFSYAAIHFRPFSGQYEFWGIELFAPLPTVYLSVGNGTYVILDLQTAFVTVYRRGRYDKSVIYDSEHLEPGVDPADWAMLLGKLSS